MPPPAPPAARLDGARRLEACDDLLLRIFRCLSLPEKAPLALASKRWQRLVLSEVTVKEEGLAARRLVEVIKWAGQSLQSLDVSHPNVAPYVLFDEVAAALSDHCPNVRTVVFWSAESAEHLPSSGMCTTKTLQLARACPLLDESCRIVISAANAAEYMSALDVLPGRHAVTLRTPPGDDVSNQDFCQAKAHALRSLLLHRRTASLRLEAQGNTVWGRVAAETVLEALGHSATTTAALPAQQPGQQAPPAVCSLECLALIDTDPASNEPAALAEGAATSLRTGTKFHYAGLQGLAVSGFCSQLSVDARLLALCSPGPLRRLSLRHTSSLTNAGELASLLAPFRLESFALKMEGVAVREAAATMPPVVAELLASPDARLSSLTLELDCRGFIGQGVDLARGRVDPDGVEHPAPFSVFSGALARNTSLRELVIGHPAGAEGAVLLAGALSSRAAPLRRLALTHSTVGPAGVTVVPPTHHQWPSLHMVACSLS